MFIIPFAYGFAAVHDKPINYLVFCTFSILLQSIVEKAEFGGTRPNLTTSSDLEIHQPMLHIAKMTR